MSAYKSLFRLHQTPSLRRASGAVASPESFCGHERLGWKLSMRVSSVFPVRALFYERQVPDEALLEGMLSAAPVTECGYSAP
jgi:hypothetical protein